MLSSNCFVLRCICFGSVIFAAKELLIQIINSGSGAMNVACIGREEENNKSARRTNHQCQLLDETTLLILSYLPLSSLFRSKSVCKLWNTLFLHPHLSFLHYRLSNFCGLGLDDVDIGKEKGDYFTTIRMSSQGLHLQQTINNASSPNLRYRIQCPTLLQSLAIPNPQNPSLCIALEFVPSNQPAVKLVSVHDDEQNQYSLGYEVLTLAIGSDQTTYCWRAIKVPPPNLSNNERDGRKRKSIEVLFRMGVAYCISYIEMEDDDLDIEVDVLDMVNESYIGHTTLPRGFFSKLSSTNLSDWNGRLSFAELVKDELHVLVLDDHMKLKWAEKKRIIKLTFLKPDNKELMTFITCADKSMLFFVRQDKKSFSTYDINTRSAC